MVPVAHQIDKPHSFINRSAVGLPGPSLLSRYFPQKPFCLCPICGVAMRRCPNDIASGEVDRRIVVSTCEHPDINLPVPYICRLTDDLWRDWAKLGSGNTLWDEAESIIKNRRVATNQVRVLVRRISPIYAVICLQPQLRINY